MNFSKIDISSPPYSFQVISIEKSTDGILNFLKTQFSEYPDVKLSFSAEKDGLDLESDLIFLLVNDDQTELDNFLNQIQDLSKVIILSDKPKLTQHKVNFLFIYESESEDLNNWLLPIQGIVNLLNQSGMIDVNISDLLEIMAFNDVVFSYGIGVGENKISESMNNAFEKLKNKGVDCNNISKILISVPDTDKMIEFCEVGEFVHKHVNSDGTIKIGMTKKFEGNESHFIYVWLVD